MTTAARPAVAGPAVASTSSRVRHTLARHPEWWLHALAAGAFLILALLGPVTGVDPHHTGRDLAGPGGGSAAVAWAFWMLMVLAMMLPVLAPQSRRIAVRSLWRRRQRAIAGHLVGYLALWGLAGAAVVGFLAAVGVPHPPPAVAVAVLVGGAVWQVAPARRRVLLRCETPRPAPVRGWSADRACGVAGWRAGTRCVVTCGPAMLAMAVSHSLLLMLGLLALLLSERARGPNPERRAARPDEAWGFLACAAVTAVLG